MQNKCIMSWQKFATGFKIMRWDESNCDIEENTYVIQAYQSGKWAFVADYFRFKILFEHGGIYMDTDTEIHKNLDLLCNHKAFFAFEKQDTVHAGIIGATPFHPIVLAILETYNKDTFIGKLGKPKFVPVPVRITNILQQNGLKLDGCYQELDDEVAIYPANVLTLDMADGKCIVEHHYEFTWRTTNTEVSYKEYLIKENTRNSIISKLRRKIKRSLSRIKIYLRNYF